MTWNLFLDDERFPFWVYDRPSEIGGFHILRSTEAAKGAVQAMGMPHLISFDHDLGGDDKAMHFLNWLANEYWDGKSPIPDYRIHSANPIGQKNIESFMESWRKSLDL